jgi:hypothetical protein
LNKLSVLYISFLYYIYQLRYKTNTEFIPTLLTVVPNNRYGHTLSKSHMQKIYYFNSRFKDSRWEMICIILITYLNFCFVYQLLFNRMKQIIDVYDFDFADTIWNEKDIIYNCKNCHVWLQSLFLLSISFVFFLFVLLFITFFSVVFFLFVLLLISFLCTYYYIGWSGAEFMYIVCLFMIINQCVML